LLNVTDTLADGRMTTNAALA